MAKDPAILFYTGDFITGTLTMTDEQRGKYILLLCLQHQKGGLTEKDMLNICKTYDEDVFEKFIKNSDGKFYNKRMEYEILKRKAYSESRSINRRGKIKTSKTYVNHMEDEDENKDVIINVNKNKEIFEKSRELFPGTKKGNDTEYDNFVKKHKDWKDVLPLLLPAVEKQIKYRANIPSDKFIAEWKHFRTWINQRCWEDEMSETVSDSEWIVEKRKERRLKNE